MKTIKLYLTACLLLVATMTFAQFANTKAASSTSTNTRSIDTNGWSRISVSYNPLKIVTDYEGSDDLNMTGFSVGYTKGFNIAKELPLFLEVGINGLYASKSLTAEDDKLLKELKDQGYNMEQKITSVSLNIPINLAYKFSISNSDISIIPFLGINLKGNIIGKAKYKLDTDLNDTPYDSEKEFWEDFEDELSMKQETNLFDKKEAGGKDAQWKRFQIGWQIGVGLNYNKLYVGISYGKDFTELCKKTKVATTSITLGYNF